MPRTPLEQSDDWESGRAYLNPKHLSEKNHPKIQTINLIRSELLQKKLRCHDGAICALNGVEVERFHMESGLVASATFTNNGVGNAIFGGPVTVGVPKGTAVVGRNRFAVEVHQNTLRPRDAEENPADSLR